MPRHPILPLAALCCAVGCAGPSVFTNRDPTADFASYRTFGFAAALGTDHAEYGSLLSQFLRTAVTREMTARGYTESPTPDLLVNFFLYTQEKLRTTQAPTGYYGYRRYDAWYPYPAYETQVTQYTEGTLNVDVIDRERNQLIWEATLIGRVTDKVRDSLEESVDTAIAEVFAKYPIQQRSPESTGLVDDSTPARDLRALAERGDANAQFLLGAMSYSGKGGVPRDAAAAADWYRKAAAQGHARAQSNLGMLFLEGSGVTRNDTEAARWLQQAAEGGVADAQFAFGRLCIEGRGITRDEPTGARWIESAATAGVAPAQTDLALMHMQGRGVAKDYEAAFRWFSEAANQGDPRAQDRLGMMYQYGRGVAEDAVAAYAWYSLGASGGVVAAESKRDLIAKSMTPSQLTQAEQRAQDWIETHAR